MASASVFMYAGLSGLAKKKEKRKIIQDVQVHLIQIINEYYFVYVLHNIWDIYFAQLLCPYMAMDCSI